MLCNTGLNTPILNSHPLHLAKTKSGIFLSLVLLIRARVMSIFCFSSRFSMEFFPVRWGRAPGRSWTCDLRITDPTLFNLSHWGIPYMAIEDLPHLCARVFKPRALIQSNSLLRTRTRKNNIKRTRAAPCIRLSWSMLLFCIAWQG